MCWKGTDGWTRRSDSASRCLSEMKNGTVGSHARELRLIGVIGFRFTGVAAQIDRGGVVLADGFQRLSAVSDGLSCAFFLILATSSAVVAAYTASNLVTL